MTSKAERRTYRCAMCGGTFRFDKFHDETAVAEFKKNFPNVPVDEKVAIVCDSCYQKVRP